MNALRIPALGALVVCLCLWLMADAVSPSRLRADSLDVADAPAEPRQADRPHRRRTEPVPVRRVADPSLLAVTIAPAGLSPLPPLPSGYPDVGFGEAPDASLRRATDDAPPLASAGEGDPHEIAADPLPPHLVLAVNDGDEDADGVPGFADGFDGDGRGGTADDTPEPGTHFARLQLTLAAHAKAGTARVRLVYDASDPARLRMAAGEPRGSNGLAIVPAAGSLRIWTRDQPVRRAIRPGAGRGLRRGHYLAPATYQAERIGLRPGGRVALFVESVRPSHDAGDRRITIEVETRHGQVVSWTRQVIRVTSLRVDLSADTDRDGRITRADDRGETGWDSGPGSHGALVLLNCDRDQAGRDASDGGPPDNWSGGDWNEDGVVDESELPDDTINSGGDLADITRVWLRPVGADGLPRDLAGLRATLELRPLPDEDPYFHDFKRLRTGTLAFERLRVFLPGERRDGALVPAVGDRSMLGPEHLRVFVRFGDSPDCHYPLDPLRARAGMQLGVEGIEPGAAVDLVWTVFIHEQPIGRDVLRLRVTPLVLNDNRQPALRDRPGTPSVIVADDGPANAMLRHQLTRHFGQNRVAQVPDNGDTWHQDGYEVAYARSPIGALPVIIELPRGDGGLNEFVREDMLRPGIGAYSRIARLDAGGLQDYGGNIETLPRGRGPAEAVFGEGMSDPLAAFFRAQAVNPVRTVRVDWLWVGHVDEVFTASPDGVHVVVADPEAAWALLMWAARNHPDTTIPGDWAGQGPDDHITLRMAIEGGHLAELRRFNLEYMAGPQALGQFVERLALPSPVSLPLPGKTNLGTVRLERAGALPGFLEGVDEPRRIVIEFTSRTDYDVFIVEPGTGREVPAGSACLDDDIAFPAAGCFVLRHWWSGSPERGDRLTFDVDPDARMVGIPVLFHEMDPQQGSALTNNPVNCLVDGHTVFAAYIHDPTVPGPFAAEDDGSDMFNDYTRAVLHRAGFRRVHLVDDRSYHVGNGGIHCGTNVIRALPSVPWWESPPAAPVAPPTDGADEGDGDEGDGEDR